MHKAVNLLKREAVFEMSDCTCYCRQMELQEDAAAGRDRCRKVQVSL